MSYVSGRIPGYARCTATPAGRMNRLKHDETHPVVVDPAAARAAPRANISGAFMTSARWSLAGSIVLAGLMVLVGLVTVPNLVPWGSQQRPIDPWAIGLIVVAGLATGLRRWPLPSFALCVGATSAYLLLGYPFGTILISVGVATYDPSITTMAELIKLADRAAFLAKGQGRNRVVASQRRSPSA